MYEFASGKLNVLEKNIFDKLDQERMLTSPNFKSAFEVLYDTDLAQGASKTNVLEKIFEQDFVNLKGLFSKILEEPKIIFFLFLQFDRSNIKLALKKFAKKDIELPYISWAVEKPQKIEQWASGLCAEKFNNKKMDVAALPELNPWIKKMLFLTIKLLKKLEAKEIEIAADKAYFKVKWQIAGQIDSFLKNITKMETEKRSSKNFQNIFSEKVFQKARETSCGIEKVLSFFQRKLNAQHNIRLILFAKKNEIDTAEIENKLLII